MDTLRSMHAFVRVAQTGSFSAVAKEQRTSQASISKRIAALEKELGAKLLTRSSRNNTMTESGLTYYERCLTILAEVQDANAEVGSVITGPKGLLRITAPVSFAKLFIAPTIAEFIKIYPELNIDLRITDRFLNLVTEGIDVAIRVGEQQDSSMKTRHLVDFRYVVVATPAYLEKYGSPNHPNELKNHNCISFSPASDRNNWYFRNQSRNISVGVFGSLNCDNDDLVIEAVLLNLGITLLPNWSVMDHLNSGNLVRLLPEYEVSVPTSLVYPDNRYLPLKTKYFMDFLISKLSKNWGYS